jgi:hypothetical protein
MKRTFVIAAIGVCGILAILFLFRQKGDLRTALENAQAKAHRAIRNADFDAFVRHVQGRPGRGMIDRAEFKRASEDEMFQELMLNDIFLDLGNKANFLTIKTEPGWAAYYAETDLDDPNCTSATVFMFKQEGRSWKACGGVFGLTKARPDSDMAKGGMAAWKGRDDMLDTIETDPRFDLGMLVGKMTGAVHPSLGDSEKNAEDGKDSGEPQG